MSELRWTLLIIGVVFIGALAWWERRRPRQAWSGTAAPSRRASRDESRVGGLSADESGAILSGQSERRAHAPSEPWIGEAGLAQVVLSDVVLADAATAEPEPDAELLSSPLAELPTVVIDESSDLTRVDTGLAGRPEDATDGSDLSVLQEPAAEAAALAALEPIRAVESEPGGAEGIIGPVRIVEAFPEPLPGASTPLPQTVVEPIVEWPPEDARRILALRLVAAQPERFQGRTLRLALAAEGFLLGKFSIFHKPDESHRAVLSAASLTRPGSFDPDTMDSQRYGGLSLFAVLPGPRSPQQAFDELLTAARSLNERLRGALQDERGGPLTPLRIASIRENLQAEAAGGSPHEG